MAGKKVVYQLVVRYFGNTGGANAFDGDLATNGCGKFADVNEAAVAALVELGVTHVWLTGALRQATLTDYSTAGLPADPPEVVKGRAGSCYAVRDYCDVCPDYAVDPAQRMAEFEALVGRLHVAGLKIILDLVPNHVSRNYSSANSACDFGAGDDQTRFFDPQNNFFYLANPPGQELTLPFPERWRPRGVAFTGSFAREDGGPGRVPRATGDNVAVPWPGQTSWYETVKLNYGWDFTRGTGSYAPRPRTWTMIDAVLAFWQAKGVDGFRCDFVHYVPAEAWAYLIGQARQRRPDAFFVGEAYFPNEWNDPVRSRTALIQAGFDAVYHATSYEELKNAYRGESLDAYDHEMLWGLADGDRVHLLEYLENHDERRIPSPIVSDGGPGDSGFGSADAGRQLAPLQFLSGPGPVLIFNGQEVGERGEGATGFKGDNGRTTIFDYWRMPQFSLWVNDHRYDGGGLDPAARSLRSFYRDLLALCADPCVAEGGYWGLRYANRPWSGPGCSDWLYAFARYAPGEGRALVVVANFRPDAPETGQLRLPPDFLQAAGLDAASAIPISLVLDATGKRADPVGRFTPQELELNGLQATVARQACNVYRIG
jgi:glycosidase